MRTGALYANHSNIFLSGPRMLCRSPDECSTLLLLPIQRTYSHAGFCRLFGCIRHSVYFMAHPFKIDWRGKHYIKIMAFILGLVYVRDNSVFLVIAAGFWLFPSFHVLQNFPATDNSVLSG